MPSAGTDEPVSPGFEFWAAEQVVRMHAELEATAPGYPQDRVAGRCARCEPDGTCTLLASAQAYVAEVEALRRSLPNDQGAI